MKTIEFANNFFKSKGYEILEDNYADGKAIISRFKDELVFISVSKVEDCFKEEIIDREKLENMMFDWLQKNEEEYGVIRFDTFCVRFVNNKNGFVRHHINALHEPIEINTKRDNANWEVAEWER